MREYAMHTQGQGHNQRSKVKFLPSIKTTVSSIIKPYAKVNSNEICFYQK